MNPFKKAIAYRIVNPVTTEKLLLLNDHPVTDPDKTRLAKIGWRHPRYKESEDFAMRIPFVGDDRYFVLCMTEVKRNIKEATLKRAVSKRVRILETYEERKVRFAEKASIRADVLSEALPGALCEENHTLAYIDYKNNLLIVGVSSHSKAENFISELRKILGSLAVMPITTKHRPDAIMNEWVKDNSNPSHISIDGDLIFKDPFDISRTSKLRKIDIDSQVITEIIEEGMIPQELNLKWDLSENSSLTFSLKDDLRLDKIKISENYDDEGEFGNEEDEEADQRSRYEASALIAMDTLSLVLMQLVEIFGGCDE